MGPSKGGKTSSILLTCPTPTLVLNGDGKNALQGAENLGAKFEALDVVDARSWRKLSDYAYDAAEAGEYATVVVDTITLIIDSIYEELRTEMDKSWTFWEELYDRVMDPFRVLLDAECHLFIVAHHIPSNEETGDGVLPAIQGKAKTRIPAKVNDIIWLDVNTKKDPVRGFLLGPQGSWGGSGRSIKGASKRIPADVGVLFEEMGIKP